MGRTDEPPQVGQGWEIERDRHGVMCHPELEIGECRRVVEADRAERIEAAARELEEAVLAYEMSSVHHKTWPRVAEARRRLMETLLYGLFLTWTGGSR